MKRALVVALILAVFALGCIPALADDLGVQIIGGENPAMETLNLDDMQLGQSYRIEGYAIVNPVSFDFFDCFAQYMEGMAGDTSHGDSYSDDSSLVFFDNGSWYHPNVYWNDSGSNAEFAWLLMDVTNLRKTDVKFMEEITVKVVFDDEYEYAGWVRQLNHDYRTTVYRKNHDGDFYTAAPYEDETRVYADFAIDPANEESIGQMYTGNYVIGCTLPNAVVNGSEPLRIEIQMGENELTYNIRK